MHGAAGGIVGHDALGADQQQRIRLAVAARVEGAPLQQIFADRPQRGGQRIARSQPLVEIGRDELDALGLQDDGVGAAFEVDRAAMGLVRPVVWKDGVGPRTPLGLLLGVGQSVSGLGQFALDLPQLAFRGAALRGGVEMVEVQVDARGAQLGDPVAQRRAWSSMWPRASRASASCDCVISRDFFNCSIRHCAMSRAVFRSAACADILAAASRAACARAARVTATSKGIRAPIVQISTAKNGNSDTLGEARQRCRR